MAKPLDPKQIVTVQELAITNMLEIEALRELLFEKGIIIKDEFIAKFKKLDREMKEKRGRYASGQAYINPTSDPPSISCCNFP